MGHARAISDASERLLTAIHEHSEPVNCAYIHAGRWVHHLPIFQAGHDGPIPFARSHRSSPGQGHDHQFVSGL
jgi:hypothetical protein